MQMTIMNILMGRNGMNNLKKQCAINREELSNEHYFQSILKQASELKLLTNKEQESIKLQSIEILVKQTERYTGGESSSVREDTAQSLMLSIFYCIGVYLKSLQDEDLAICELKQKHLYEIYKQGRKLIDIMIIDSQKLLEAVRQNRFITENEAYNDTVEKGVELFFHAYDADFAAHDGQGSIDYPLSNDKMDMVGIEYINNYLSILLLENQFCNNFSSHTINCLLRGYYDSYEDLLINIFYRVLVNALGCILAGKNVLGLNIEPDDLLNLQQKLEKLSTAEIFTILQRASDMLFKQLDILNEKLQEYISMALHNISSDIKNALKNHRLRAVFVKLKEKEIKQDILFYDGTRMDDEVFRKIADEIRKCRFVSDKIALIKRNIHSINDLTDILEGSCIFNDEFDKVFDSLEDLELGLLLKMIPLSCDGLQFDDMENQEEWKNSLLNYLDKISIDRRNRIKVLSDNIK